MCSISCHLAWSAVFYESLFCASLDCIFCAIAKENKVRTSTSSSKLFYFFLDVMCLEPKQMMHLWQENNPIKGFVFLCFISNAALPLNGCQI